RAPLSGFGSGRVSDDIRRSISAPPLEDCQGYGVAPLDSPGFFSTIPNSADRFFVILLKLTLKAGGRASPTSNSIHGAIDGCVRNCEIPRRHWRGRVADSNGVECNGIPVGHYIRCSKLPPEQVQ